MEICGSLSQITGKSNLFTRGPSANTNMFTMHVKTHKDPFCCACVFVCLCVHVCVVSGLASVFVCNHVALMLCVLSNTSDAQTSAKDGDKWKRLRNSWSRTWLRGQVDWSSRCCVCGENRAEPVEALNWPIKMKMNCKRCIFSFNLGATKFRRFTFQV